MRGLSLWSWIHIKCHKRIYHPACWVHMRKVTKPGAFTQSNEAGCVLGRCQKKDWRWDHDTVVHFLLCSGLQHRMRVRTHLLPAQAWVRHTRSLCSAVVRINLKHLWQASTLSSRQKLTLSTTLVISLLSLHRGCCSGFLQGSRLWHLVA